MKYLLPNMFPLAGIRSAIFAISRKMPITKEMEMFNKKRIEMIETEKCHQSYFEYWPNSIAFKWKMNSIKFFKSLIIFINVYLFIDETKKIEQIKTQKICDFRLECQYLLVKTLSKWVCLSLILSSSVSVDSNSLSL